MNDAACTSLKQFLQQSESTPGRVRLATFYSKKNHLHWAFQEKIEYLRHLGTLDESNPSSVKVIIANYAVARQNCLDGSNLLAVCCPNECEGLQSKLEALVGSPSAPPQKIIE